MLFLHTQRNTTKCHRPYRSESVEDAHISKKSSVLSIASIFSNNKVLLQLLSARADVKAHDYFGGTALSVAAAYNNTDAVRILWEAGIDARVRAFPGASAFKLACCFDSLQSMKEIMNYFPVSLRFSLHCALAFVGDGDTISSLIKASADINEQLAIPPGHGSWWMLLKGLSLRHSFSSSALTYLAYHHRGATPIMFSIMTGKFGATSILLEAGARLDIRNSRGKTAEDILRETQAPVVEFTLSVSFFVRSRGGKRFSGRPDDCGCNVLRSILWKRKEHSILRSGWPCRAWSRSLAIQYVRRTVADGAPKGALKCPRFTTEPPSWQVPQ